jgi:hypothetical protein
VLLLERAPDTASRVVVRIDDFVVFERPGRSTALAAASGVALR